MRPSVRHTSGQRTTPAFGYTSVGHVTIDVLSDGTRRPGGGALYSALQAARMGRRARVVTRGVVAEIEALLEPFARELELEIQPSSETTALETIGSGGDRRQRVLAWAGPIEPPTGVDSVVLHIAPVARETPADFHGRAEFIGLTPQGLVRRWPGERREIELMTPSGEPLAGAPERCDAIVVSDSEHAACAALIAAARAAGAVAAVTAQAAPTRLLLPGGHELEVDVPRVEHPVDDLGAGDVFAAALFIALADGATPREANDLGTAAAAVRMGGFGAAAIGTLAAIEGRLRAVSQSPSPAAGSPRS